MVTPTAVMEENSWLTVVATYVASSGNLELSVGGVVVSTTCSARKDRMITKTYVGKSQYASGKTMQSAIAGLYTVDAVLSQAEIF